MKTQKNNDRGITLISLVVTIIILLILAGVTLVLALSNNGLFNRAKEATDSYQISSEKEYLEQNIISVQLDKLMENVSSQKQGEPLYDKNIKNGDKWHIISANDNVYGTNWNYIEKGTELQDYGKAQNSWLVNYDTGEIIQLEENEYSSVTVKDTIAIRDDLIINIDSAMLDNNVQNTKESIEAALGKGVELHNFDFQNDGLINNKFVFDGENDFITINYKDFKEEQDNEDSDNSVEWFENGFTFEFYGNLERGTHWAYSNGYRGTKLDSQYKELDSAYGIFQVMYQNDDNIDRISRVFIFGQNYPQNSIKTDSFFLAFRSDEKINMNDDFGPAHWKTYKTVGETAR